jgi:hypothetical protein
MFLELLAKHCVLLVFLCILMISISMTMAATGVIRRRYLPDVVIQWLLMKPWMCSIGRCARIVPPHLHGNQNYQ